MAQGSKGMFEERCDPNADLPPSAGATVAAAITMVSLRSVNGGVEHVRGDICQPEVAVGWRTCQLLGLRVGERG